MKKLFILLFLFSVIIGFSLDMELYGGWNFTIDSSDTSSFFDLFVDLPLTVNNNTEFGISVGYLNTGNFAFQSYGKYNIETSFGIFSTYGKGGAIFENDLALNSIGYSVLAGVRYYFDNLFFGFSYAVYYISNEKITTLPIEIGYNIDF